MSQSARQRALDAYREAMARVSNPEALEVYDSNSFRRVGLAREYKELVYACNQSDGHPDIAGTDLLRAMVAAYNVMLTWAEQEASGWQPIETAPADADVLLFCPRRHETNPARIELRQARNTRGGSHHAWATHWMPLPTPPGAAPAPPRGGEQTSLLQYVEGRLVRAEAELLRLGKPVLDTQYFQQFPDPYIPGALPVEPRGALPNAARSHKPGPRCDGSNCKGHPFNCYGHPYDCGCTEESRG